MKEWVNIHVFNGFTKLVEKNARLKELNREMMEAIGLHCDQCKNEQGIANCNVTECIWHKLLAKAERRVNDGD